MKFVYLTSKTFPATTADHFFVREMARAFAGILGDDFLLVVWNDRTGSLRDIPHYSLGKSGARGKSAFFALFLPFFIRSRGFSGDDTVFFSNDANLLALLVLWKKVSGGKYRIVSDWHMISRGGREAAAARGSDALISTTKHLARLVAERYGVPKERFLAAYGGVELSRFETRDSRAEIRRRLHLPEDAFLVGYIGFYKTLGVCKGLDTMMDALGHIHDKNVQMVFVGGKPDEIREYSIEAEKRGISSRVIFVSVVPAEEIALYEMAMDILVIPYPDLPHFRDYGFPMKAYEYLAAKRPVIFSDLPVMREVLSDCAVPFEPGDGGDLSEKILSIKRDPSRSSSLAARGYEKARESTWRARAEKILHFIENRI